MEKLLTIAIPTYNRENYLYEALDSIISQYDQRVEVLVSDNASTDGTEKLVCEKFPMVKYNKNEKNIGPDHNFLQCYRRALGKFVMIMGDDDVILPGALAKLLDFLSDNDQLSLAFLNHIMYHEKFIDQSHSLPPVICETENNLITTDKKRFMSYAKFQITFVSALVFSKESFERIENPERYIGTFFLHTCLALELTKDEKSIMGVLTVPCVGQNTPYGSARINPETVFKVFGPNVKYVFCEVGGENGYDIHQIKQILSKTVCRMFTSDVLTCKILKIEGWRSAFWKSAFPAVREYPRAWVTVVPAVFLPTPIARMIRRRHDEKKRKIFEG